MLTEMFHIIKDNSETMMKVSLPRGKDRWEESERKERGRREAAGSEKDKAMDSCPVVAS